MKLKYQMRGLGIGIVVTALLMGVATKDGLPLSDAEIRAKALTLGMVESDSLKLTDIQNMVQPSGETPGPVDGQSGEDVPDGGEEQKELSEDRNGESGGTASAEDTEDAVQASGTGTGSDIEAPGSGTGEKEGTSGNENGADGDDPEDGTVTVQIESGMNSYSASVVIAEAGLVEDAAVLDRYLCEQGYSRKIADGTYKIPVGATEEEIAKIITKGR